MKKRMGNEVERMAEVKRKDEEYLEKEREKAAEKLRRMEARERGEEVEGEEEDDECGENDVLDLHPQPNEFFGEFGRPGTVDVRLVDAQRDFQRSSKQKQVVMGPFRERGNWERSPLPQREKKDKGKGKGKGKTQQEEEKEEERDVADRAHII